MTSSSLFCPAIDNIGLLANTEITLDVALIEPSFTTTRTPDCFLY